MYSFNFCLGKCVWGEKIALFCPIWNRNDSTVYSWMVSLPILAFCCWHFGSGRKNLACFVFWHFGMLMGNNAAAIASAVCLAQKCVMIISCLINNFMIEKNFQSDVLDDRLLWTLQGFMLSQTKRSESVPWFCLGSCNGDTIF